MTAPLESRRSRVRKSLYFYALVTGLTVCGFLFFFYDGKYASERVEKPSCPTGGTFKILDARFPVSALALGFSPGFGLIDALAAMANTLEEEKLPFPFYLLIPETQHQESLSEITALKRMIRNPDRIAAVKVKAHESLWAQDMMESAFSGDRKTPVLIDLPYRADEGDAAPQALAEKTQWPIHSLGFDIVQNAESANGSYGGNIEPLAGDMIAVGNNIDARLRDFLVRETHQTIVDVPTAWLDTGHVDELLQVMTVGRASDGDCPFAILRASPGRALDILRKQGFAAGAKLSPTLAKGMGTASEKMGLEPYLECFAAYAGGANTTDICREWEKANVTYEKILARSTSHYKDAIRKQFPKTCDAVSIIEAPQLFYPAALIPEYGGSIDGARALNPNLANALVIENLIFAPRQSYQPFADDFLEQAGARGFKVQYLNADILHHLGGGLHCQAQVVRVCVR